MPEAKVRNAVPMILEIPEPPQPLPPVFLHKVIAEESNGFALRQSTQSLEDSDRYGAFRFHVQPELLKIWFTYNLTDHGAPDRGSYERSLFPLKPDQAGSLYINGRFSSERRTEYKLHTVNLGYVTRYSKDLFLTCDQAHSLDLKTRLF